MVLHMDVSQHRVVFFLLTLIYRGQAEEISVTQSVKAKLGDDVVLPCQMDPPIDAFSMTVEWGRPDLRPRFVFVWFDGKGHVTNQNQAYSGRASMSTDKLKTGDLSLTLSKVKTSDNGTYRCYIPTMDEEYFVDLLVGASSPPAISLMGIDKVSSRVMLDCESKGLYPEPEVLWLDSKDELLSSDPKKSVKGADGLFNVSSRVTVTRRHNNIFTCKLQQKSINWTSEAHIHVADDVFVVPTRSITSTVFAVLFGLISVAASGLLVWQWKKQKTEKKRLKNSPEYQLLMVNKLKDELQKKEEEQKNFTPMLETLKGLTEELLIHKKQLNLLKEDVVEKGEQRCKSLELVDKDVSQEGRDETLHRAQKYYILRDILEEDSEKQQERKRELQELNMGIEKLMRKTFEDMNEITKRKEKVVDQVNQIVQQIKKIESQQEASEV